MTDREWAFRIHDAMHSTKGFTTWNSDASDAIDAFRAEVLKEAEENTWNWLIGLSSDNFPMSRDKLHSAILDDKEQI